MESVHRADRNSPPDQGPLTDVGELSDRELDDRLAALGRERCRVEALFAEAAAEKHRRVGGRAAAATVREKLHMTARQATAEVELAATVASQFPATLAVWRSGEITAGHARVIAKVGDDPEHADEPALLEMARGVPVDLFARMTRHYAAQTDSCAEHTRQHRNRWASLIQDPDGSWRLTAYYDYDTGKRISIAFNQMVRTYRSSVAINGIDRTDKSTPQQRRADALANLITGEGPHNRPDTTLLVIADYDTVTRQLRNLRYDDGLPIPAHRIAEFAARAKILPAIFDAEGDPLWLGRAARDASTGQRAVLVARDGGCATCAAPAEATEPHHIEWFSRGGPTDIDNLALLCERCHHLIHDDGWQLHRNNDHLTLRPPPPGTAPPRPRHNTRPQHGTGHPRPQRKPHPANLIASTASHRRGSVSPRLAKNPGASRHGHVDFAHQATRAWLRSPDR